MKRIIAVLLVALLGAYPVFADAPVATEAFEAYVTTLFPDTVPGEYELAVLEEMFGYSSRIDAVETTVADAISANSADNKLLRSIDRDCEQLDNEMDACEDSLEASYRAKSIDSDTFYLFDAELERFDERLDKIEDQLERNFGYDD